jgi:hypothetical protein
MSGSAHIRTGVTVRLAPAALARLRRIAEIDHRSVAGYLEWLVERELAARDDAERVVRVYVAPELTNKPQGRVQREAGESAARHGRRRTTLNRLFGQR